MTDSIHVPSVECPFNNAAANRQLVLAEVAHPNVVRPIRLVHSIHQYLTLTKRQILTLEKLPAPAIFGEAADSVLITAFTLQDSMCRSIKNRSLTDWVKLRYLTISTLQAEPQDEDVGHMIGHDRLLSTRCGRTGKELTFSAERCLESAVACMLPKAQAHAQI